MKRKTNKFSKAVSVLKNSGIIIYPTETVYGLGANIFDKKAVNKIREIKGRGFRKPISIALSNKSQIKKYAFVSKPAKKFFKVLPGPITLVLPKKKIVPSWITKSKFVGIRVPENKTAQKIIKKLGKPITSTSANLSGKKPPVSAKQIAKRIAQSAELIINEGKTKYKVPSTVIKISGKKVEVLR